MATPPFTFRLAQSERVLLQKMAKVYGAPDASGFVREMVRAMCSGDQAKLHLFLSKLAEGLNGQRALDLMTEAQVEIQAAKASTARTLHAKRTKRTKRT